MDVAPGATNVPLPRKLNRAFHRCLKKFFILATGPAITPAVLIALAAQIPAIENARAATDADAMQPSGDRMLWDRKHHKIELFNHAIVRQEGETLSADYITVDFINRTLDAKGNCVYVTAGAIVYGDEMHLNIDTRTGVVVGARVTNDSFSLSGERINKLSDTHFLAHWGEYSTCKDCPNSWSLEAEEVDMTFEHYAYMSNVTAKVKDAPTFWLPYLIVPVKSKRQSGFLFPHFGLATNYGFVFVEPFFWATSRSTDMTIGVGEYTARGRRLEWEGRYALTTRSKGTANFYNVNDKVFSSVKQERWGLNVGQTQELPFGIDEKLKVTEVSDTYYPIDYYNDVQNNGNLVLTSDLIFDYSTSDISAFIDAKRVRNIIDLNPDPVRRFTEFDPTTVQELPSGVASTNDRFILGTPVAAGLSMGITNFTRTGGPFDFDNIRLKSLAPGQIPTFEPGIDPIREATRFSYTPTLYTTLRPFDVVNLVPSAHYYGYYYNFHNSAPNLSRGYLLLQADLSTQLEKIWDTPDPDHPKQKNLIRPMLTYSNIPYIKEDRNHPFLEQIQYAQTNGFSGYNFDDYDIVPVDNTPSDLNYFTPLGNSLSYGFKTQLITRNGAEGSDSPSYSTPVEWLVGDALNFRQFQNSPTNRQPFSRVYSTLTLNVGKYTSGTTYYYYPYTGMYANVFSTSHTYIFERSVHQHVLQYDRSFTLNFTRNQVGCTGASCGTLDLSGSMNFSINDYFMPTFYADQSFVLHQFNTAGAGLVFQSPAQCWRLNTNVDYTVQTKTTSFSFNLQLNLSGSGFENPTQM